jgi:hypothetical protein
MGECFKEREGIQNRYSISAPFTKESATPTVSNQCFLDLKIMILTHAKHFREYKWTYFQKNKLNSYNRFQQVAKILKGFLEFYIFISDV